MDTSQVAKLRQMTGCGMMDCKTVLEETGGDLEKAADELRKKGMIKAAKRGGRETREGVVASYIHSNKKMGAMVELLCETDFVARNEEFQKIANDLAMHVVASNPLYFSPEDVPEEVLNKEKDFYKEEFEGSGKPEDIVNNIIEGKLNKYYEEVCLLNQKFVKDEDVTVGDLVKQKVGVLGENIKVGGFKRFEI